MKKFFKYGLLVFLAGLYLWHGITLPCYIHSERIVMTEETDTPGSQEFAYHQSALFAGDVMREVSIHEVNSFQPFFRYFYRGVIFSVMREEHDREVSPSFRNIHFSFLDSFAVKQDVGYYIYGLRKIIV